MLRVLKKKEKKRKDDPFQAILPKKIMQHASLIVIFYHIREAYVSNYLTSRRIALIFMPVESVQDRGHGWLVPCGGDTRAPDTFM